MTYYLNYLYTYNTAHLLCRCTFWHCCQFLVCSIRVLPLHREHSAGFMSGKAGLLTLLHPEAPSHRHYRQWRSASEFKGSSQLRDSRGFSPHSQLIAFKRTFYSVPLRMASACVVGNQSIGKRPQIYDLFIICPNKKTIFFKYRA